jgi:hypothetical protein
MRTILHEVGEVVLGAASFLVGAAALYLFSFGRAKPLNVNPDLVMLIGLTVLFALVGVGALAWVVALVIGAPA